jgi:hypothetical protein
MRTERRDRAATSVSLWFGMLGGPLAWAAHEQLSYALVPPACYGGNAWPLHLVTAGSVLVALAAGVVSLRTYASTGAEPQGAADYMAATGILASAFFLFVIVLEWIPGLMLSPCW